MGLFTPIFRLGLHHVENKPGIQSLGTPVIVDLIIAVNQVAFTFFVASAGFALFTKLLVELDLLRNPHPLFFSFLTATPIVFSMILILSHHGYFPLARILTILAIHSSSLIWSLLYGPVAHFHHFSFSYLLMPVLFYEKDRRGLVALFSTVPLGNYALVEFLKYYLKEYYAPLITVPDGIAILLWIAAGLTTTLILVLSVYLLQIQYEHQLDNLHRLSEAKAEFLRSMSHEVRTPMNSIIGLTDLLLHSQYSKDPELRHFLKTIHTSGESLLNVVDDVLDLAKIEAGKFTLATTEIVLRDYLEEIVAIFAPGADAKGIELILEVDDDISFEDRFMVDAMRLRQIFNNLLANAIKFTERGEIVILVRRVLKGSHSRRGSGKRSAHTEFLHVEIQDSGIGIPEKVLPFLFTNFYQVEQRTKKFGGTGLGLAICKNLVQAMEGEIGVDSTLNTGSNFWFTIPCPRVNNPETQSASSTANRDLVLLQKKPLWLYHPNEKLSQVLKKTFLHMGMGVRSFPTLSEIQHELSLSSQPPDFLVAPFTDLRSPLKQTAEGMKRIALVPWSKQMFFTKEVADCFISLPPSESSIISILLKEVRPQSAPDEAILSENPVSSENFGGDLEDADDSRPRMNILVAEDNPVNQRVMIQLLSSLKVDCEIAQNGMEAVEMFKKGKYHLILMDMIMPEMDGVEASITIRKIEQEENATRRIPIIATTANVTSQDRILCTQSGMTDFLSKPIRLEVLKRTVDRYREL